MRLLWGLLWALGLLALSQQEPRLLLLAPRVVHLGAPLSVSVQLQGLAPGQRVSGTVYLRNPNDVHVPCSPEVPFHMDADKDFLLLQVKVPALQASACGLTKLRGAPRMQLIVKSPWLRESGGSTDTRGLHLLFSSRRGFLFLQTDQPVYNPGQRVRFRVFALDHTMRPSLDPVTITVQNALGLQVRRKEMFSPKSILQDDLLIPDISEPGTWKISAHFSNAPDSNRSVEFEVKKYVLPNFEVKITPEQSHILVTPNDISDVTLEIEAKYVYGRPVQGVAYVRFGILPEGGQKSYLRGLEKQLKLEEGKCSVLLAGANLSAAREKFSSAALLDSRLYVAASVIESPGGELEEAELTSLRFVSSPWSLDLGATKRHLVPGTAFLLQALVRDVSGSPAPGIPVHVSAQFTPRGSPAAAAAPQLLTDAKGRVTIPINTPRNVQELNLAVSAGTTYPAKASLTARTPNTGGFGFLSIERLNLRDPRPGETLSLELRAVSADPSAFRHFYYMVLHKGQIVSVNRVARAPVTSVSVLVTEELAPAFRFVAFYTQQGRAVANSIHVTVEGTCLGLLELGLESSGTLRPSDKLRLKVRTDGKATVALSATDTAVFAVSRKAQRQARLDMAKVFDAINSYDLGCGPGGGQDTINVFQAAGLAFSYGNNYSPQRSSLKCPTEEEEEKRRVRRSAEMRKKMQDLMDRYTTREAQRCCKDGMTSLPMKRKCEERAARVPSPACRQPFLDCCRFAVQLSKAQGHRSSHGLARAQNAWQQEEELVNEDDIYLRSYFPENWMWELMDVNGVKRKDFPVPDSITTWEIRAVSLSPQKGLCVAPPVQARVFNEFHLHVSLPRSVHRFEQLELRPVLYNYLDRDLPVGVSVSPTEGLCLAGGGGREQQLTVPAHSALPVAFAAVPTAAGNLQLRVLARGPQELGIGDVVAKILRVTREGAVHTEELTYELNPRDPRGRTLEIPGDFPPNVIPDGDFSSNVRVTATAPLETFGEGGALSPGGLGSLMRVPQGCGEQTMILLSPTLAATRYLDRTEQWGALPPEAKDRSVDLIRQGYERILQFRKPNGSYGAWLHRDSSTWLSAFVLKVLSEAREQVGGSARGLRETAQWLLSQQQGDGSFQDPCPVIHREMQGGQTGPDHSTALTAFVTVALHYSLTAFQPREPDDRDEQQKQELLQRVKAAIVLADSYLSDQVTLGLLDSYATALSAYTLSLTKAPESTRNRAHLSLMAMAQKQEDALFWSQGLSSKDQPPGPEAALAPAFAVETTGYGLLHLLLHEGSQEEAGQAARWLTKHAGFGGHFRSTQDTVVALSALAEYWIRSHSPEETRLNVTLSSQGRQGPKKHVLHLSSSHSPGKEEELQFSLGNDIRVEVGGNGKGMLKILRQFHVLEEKNSTCLDLKMEVTVTGYVQYSQDADDDYAYYEEEAGEVKPAPADDPSVPGPEPSVTPLGLFEARRRRRRREAPGLGDGGGGQDDPQVLYNVCIWREGRAQLSGMAIADITLLSGFHAQESDLEKLKGLSDRYVSEYETHGPHVLLYFDQVSRTKECVAFRAVQEVPVGLVQPASAVLYDYYEPARKCSVFYSAPTQSKLLSALCAGSVCQCAEGKCPRARRPLQREEDDEDGYRMRFACYSPRVQYGFLVQVLRAESKAAFRLYEAKITQVLHYTEDHQAAENQTRSFLVRSSCRLQLEPGKGYLIMGPDGLTKDQHHNPQYLLDSETWIEELPAPRLCQATRHRETCARLHDFLEEYGSQGCQV
ncbi:complement C4-like [Tachyglossus aculeatus]|uniref:complement C4-like n=1 Tax=Tachyglossus aculeatus TaxID=9261 RepID=UPI0018F3C0D0|nr:complement C4-like [Tachyglossus aculeatus]